MIDQKILDAVIRQESGGNANAVSPKGAQGIMQIMPDTARDPGYGVRPLQGWDGVNPMTAPVEEQIRFGRDYLQAMSNLHGGNTDLALASYNAGPGAVEQYGGIPPYQETQNYVRSINSNLGQQPATTTARSEIVMNEAPLSSSWRDRASPIQQPQLNQPQMEVPVVSTSDWRNRAQPVQVAPTNDWRSRATNLAPQDPNMFQRLGDRYAQRGQQMQEAADAYVAGEQSLPETVFQHGMAGVATGGDTLGELASTLTPQFIKDAGSAAIQTVGKLPGFGGESIGEGIPKELALLNEQFPRASRNLGAGVTAAGAILAPGATQAGLNLARQGSKIIGEGLDTPLVKNLMEETAQGEYRPAPTPLPGQQELKKMAGQSYDEANYLGANFTPDQVSNKFGQALNQAKPKPIAGTVLTKEQKILSDALEEFAPLTGKSLTLDDVQTLDQALSQKINTFVDPRTGELDATGRQLYLLKDKFNDIVDEVDTSGNDALQNGKSLYKAQAMVRELESIAERASMSPNPGKTLQNGYKALYLKKDRIKGWPETAKRLLKKAATPGISDEVLDWVGSRLPAAIGLGTGNLPAAAGAQMMGVAARGVKEGTIAARGAKVQQSIVSNTLDNLRPVNIPQPTVAERLLLSSPENMSRLPMTDAEISIAQKLMSRPQPSGPDLSGSAILGGQTRLLEGPPTIEVDTKGTANIKTKRKN